jgi:hypothetical protein
MKQYKIIASTLSSAPTSVILIDNLENNTYIYVDGFSKQFKVHQVSDGLYKLVNAHVTLRIKEI